MNKLATIIVTLLLAGSGAQAQTILQDAKGERVLMGVQQDLLSCISYDSDRNGVNDVSSATLKLRFVGVPIVMGGHSLNIRENVEGSDLCAKVKKIVDNSIMRFGHAEALVDSLLVLDGDQMTETIRIIVSSADADFLNPNPEPPVELEFTSKVSRKLVAPVNP